MRIFLRLSAMLAFFMAAPVLAQGTPEQREACESDAHRICDAYVPDAIAIEKCLRANVGSVSAACQRELGVAPSTGGGKKRKR
ncbi:hypothetical protein V3H18_04690 [Methylocystis sp. 9N]|uniref:3',5'-cyclic-nucleotide phosphodiesterase n=1 Tax=Methylocystis borbori TaxID=3118750 RepID=A0ABU7XH20_9HYPH